MVEFVEPFFPVGGAAFGRRIAATAAPASEEGAGIEPDDGTDVGIISFYEMGHFLTGDIGVRGHLRVSITVNEENKGGYIEKAPENSHSIKRLDGKNKAVTGSNITTLRRRGFL